MNSQTLISLLLNVIVLMENVIFFNVSGFTNVETNTLISFFPLLFPFVIHLLYEKNSNLNAYTEQLNQPV